MRAPLRAAARSPLSDAGVWRAPEEPLDATRQTPAWLPALPRRRQQPTNPPPDTTARRWRDYRCQRNDVVLEHAMHRRSKAFGASATERRAGPGFRGTWTFGLRVIDERGSTCMDA